MTTNQAIKIATMMLQAASYEMPFITLHPIVTRKDGREETYKAIAKALALITDLKEDMFLTKLEQSNGNSDMGIDSHDGLTEDKAKQLQHEYQNAPVYQDAKGRQYIMFNGVRTQDYYYQVIDVARYVYFAPTGKYRNMEKLQKALNRRSDQLYLEALEDSGELENMSDEEYSKLQPLYR